MRSTNDGSELMVFRPLSPDAHLWRQFWRGEQRCATIVAASMRQATAECHRRIGPRVPAGPRRLCFAYLILHGAHAAGPLPGNAAPPQAMRWQARGAMPGIGALCPTSLAPPDAPAARAPRLIGRPRQFLQGLAGQHRLPLTGSKLLT